MKLTNKQLRKLPIYKRVARVRGARVAKLLKAGIEGYIIRKEGDELPDCLFSLFIWGDTKQDHRYWSKLHRKLKKS